MVWIDLEMTGLDPKQDRIIEIATVITNKHLEVIAEGPSLAIHQSDKVISKMNEWCVKQHGASGLTERVKGSKISVRKAEQMTLEFLQEYVPEGISPMCGNTVYQDRRFMYKYMPTLERYFHYRNFDVSVLKMIAQRWYPQVSKGYRKKTKHLALSDIYDSIDEMKYYMKNMFVLPL